MYGFKGELDQKFGKAEAKSVYSVCKKLFSALPLAARIGGATLVVHGGLFRKPTPAPTGKVQLLPYSWRNLERQIPPVLP